MAEGFVYLLQENGIFKIGKSIDPEYRKGQVAGPGATIVHLIQSACPLLVESALHRRFCHLRVKKATREWFNLSPHDVAAICQLTRIDNPCDIPVELQPSKDPNPIVIIQLRVPKSIAEMLKRMAEDNERQRTQEIMLALKARLKEQGYWSEPTPEK